MDRPHQLHWGTGVNIVNGVPTIDIDEAVADGDSLLLDVREYQEWMAGHVAHAVHVPMGEVVERVGELPHDRRIVCICRSGNRSARVAGWLVQQGYDAVNLAGGALQWVSLGHPLVNHVGNSGVVA